MKPVMSVSAGLATITVPSTSVTTIMLLAVSITDLV